MRSLQQVEIHMEGCNADDQPGKGGGEEEMRQTQRIRHISYM